MPPRHDRDRCIELAHRTVGQSDIWHGGTSGRKECGRVALLQMMVLSTGVARTRSCGFGRQAETLPFAAGTRSVAAYLDQRRWARLTLTGETGIDGLARGKRQAVAPRTPPVSRDPGRARRAARARAPAHRFPVLHQAFSCRASGVCPGLRTRRRDEASRGVGLLPHPLTARIPFHTDTLALLGGIAAIRGQTDPDHDLTFVVAGR